MSERTMRKKHAPPYWELVEGVQVSVKRGVTDEVKKVICMWVVVEDMEDIENMASDAIVY